MHTFANLYYHKSECGGSWKCSNAYANSWKESQCLKLNIVLLDDMDDLVENLLLALSFFLKCIFETNGMQTSLLGTISKMKMRYGGVFIDNILQTWKAVVANNKQGNSQSLLQ